MSFKMFILRCEYVAGEMEMFSLALGWPVSTGPVYELFPAGPLLWLYRAVCRLRRAGLTL